MGWVIDQIRPPRQGAGQGGGNRRHGDGVAKSAALPLARLMQWDGQTEVTTMAVIRMSHSDGRMRIGSFTRKATTSSGCNEPFKNAYWCPKRKWFAKEPCPFSNRFECMSFARFSGAI
jgi:hypothetical protein